MFLDRRESVVVRSAPSHALHVTNSVVSSDGCTGRFHPTHGCTPASTTTAAVSDKIGRGVEDAAFESEQIFGTVLHWTFADGVSFALAAAVVSETEVSGVKGTKMKTLPMVAAEPACAAAPPATEADVGGVEGTAKMTVTIVAAPPARAAADPATDRDVGDVEGAAKGKVPEISSLTACDAAAILTDKGVGGVEGVAKVKVPKIAALPACAAAATLMEKDVCGFEGAANVTVTMIATVPAYAGAATLTDKDERRRRPELRDSDRSRERCPAGVH